MSRKYLVKYTFRMTEKNATVVFSYKDTVKK